MSGFELMQIFRLSHHAHCLQNMDGSGRYYCSLGSGHAGAHQYAPIDMIEWIDQLPDDKLVASRALGSTVFERPLAEWALDRAQTSSSDEKETEHASWRQRQIYRQAETQG